ncbi:DUF3341 domain-containing protein [bacterium]|nr:MAG: DUF3341 domain-containing protein [bacterium]
MNRNLMGVFRRESEILEVTRACRERGYEIVDVYAPYPVHGLDRAMGLKPSRITWLCFALGAFGATSMLAFQIWTSAVDWPINIGGKPLNSWPAFIPVTFESAVLMAGLGTVLVLMIRSRLFPWSKPNLVHPRVTDDRFVLAIRQSDADLDPGMAVRLLREHGAIDVREDIGEGMTDIDEGRQ